MSESNQPYQAAEPEQEPDEAPAGGRRCNRVLLFIAGLVAVALLAVRHRLSGTLARGPPRSHGYDEDEARAMVYFSAASYSPKPQQCLQWAPEIASYDVSSYKVIQNDVVPCPAGILLDEKTTCGAFTACLQDWMGNCEHIVLAYRGTQHFNQLRAEVSKVYDLADFEGGKVGEYFLTAFKLLNASFNAAVAAAQQCKKCRVTVTGHSLGGAVASLAAAALSKQLEQGTDKVTLYTFGQPRTGNCVSAARHDSLVPNSYRVVNGEDVVPHVPLCEGTSPCKCAVSTADRNFYHHGTEVWYDKPFPHSPRVCTGLPKNEDVSCSNSHFTNSFSQWIHLVPGGTEHFHYFGIFVGKFCLPSQHRHPR